MQAITYATACGNLEQILNSVCEDHEPVIITRETEKAVVIISLENYNALEETIFSRSHAPRGNAVLARRAAVRDVDPLDSRPEN